MRLTTTFFYALLPAAAHTAVDYRLRKARKTRHNLAAELPYHVVTNTI